MTEYKSTKIQKYKTEKYIDNSEYDEESSLCYPEGLCFTDQRISGQIESKAHKMILCKVYSLVQDV